MDDAKQDVLRVLRETARNEGAVDELVAMLEANTDARAIRQRLTAALSVAHELALRLTGNDRRLVVAEVEDMQAGVPAADGPGDQGARVVRAQRAALAGDVEGIAAALEPSRAHEWRALAHVSTRLAPRLALEAVARSRREPDATPDQVVAQVLAAATGEPQPAAAAERRPEPQPAPVQEPTSAFAALDPRPEPTAQAPVAQAAQPAEPTTWPAGWYPDPHRPDLRRWWDGRTWTEHTVPA